MKAEQSKLPPTPLLGRKVFLDPQDSSPARSSPSSLHKQTIYEQRDYWGERNMAQPSPPPASRRLGTTVLNCTPIVSGPGTSSRIQEARNSGLLGIAAGLGVPTELKSTPIKPVREPVRPLIDVNVMAEVVLQEPGCSGGSRSELQVEQQRPHGKDFRMERQLSNEQLIQARRDELPQEVWRERAEREKKLERQTSSEQEVYETRRKDRHRLERQESSEHEREPSDKRSGGGG